MVDHIADKVVATFQLYGDQQRPSTRYKDLVDLVSIVTGASVAAGPQLAALASEPHRRGVTLPARFGIRDPALWEPGYAAEAARSLLPIARTLAEATRRRSARSARWIVSIGRRRQPHPMWKQMLCQPGCSSSALTRPPRKVRSIWS